MTLPCPPPRRIATILATAAFAALLVLPTMAIGSRAEDIPHENYDLANSNLDVVIALLNMSIGYSENALKRMYNESMVEVQENMTIVTGLLTPANRILNQIRDVADSYANLSRLLPPFTDLSTQMSSFSSMESTLLESRDDIVSTSKLDTLSPDELVNAMAAIVKFRGLINEMNKTIDVMLLSAGEIIALEVDGKQPFTNNQLIPLIEKLRDLLETIDVEIERVIHNDVHWGSTHPFLILWLTSNEYFLGEDIAGGGYLYFNSSWADGYSIMITMDGVELSTPTTRSDGTFSFSHPIPLNASWLGSHVLQATALTPVGTLTSRAISIQILLIETSISLQVDKDVLSFEEDLVATVHLNDMRGRPVIDAPCHFILDGDNVSFRTDTMGVFIETWHSRDLGYGTHTLQAFYDSELPYDSSASEVRTVVVDIPTSITLELFSTKFYLGFFVVGSGTLLANGTTPMAEQNITLSIDGIVVANLTTEQDGTFAFSIPTDSMKVGGHTIVAELLHRDSIWRYSRDYRSFTVYGLKLGKYPFWPIIPKWAFGPSDTIPYLFVGQYAYVFWLLILAALGITVRILQMRDKRKRSVPSESEVLESLEKVVAPAPNVAAAMADLAKDMASGGTGPANPNERIIWYYQRLLGFLTAKAHIALRASMTHWEVAKVLKALGFPVKPVDRATVLFEEALYSGTPLTDDDAVMMSTALTDLVRAKAKEASNAG